MGLLTLLTDLSSFYTSNPFHSQYPNGSTNGNGGSQYATAPDAISTNNFDQKSLPWGRDRINLGSSREPFIKYNIDGSGVQDVSILGNTNLNLKIPDFLFREGAISNSLIDVGRITKFLFSTPKGGLFILKQQLLEKQNNNQPYLTLGQKLYNPLATSAQVGVNAFGFHLDRTGLLGGLSFGLDSLLPDGYEKYAESRDSKVVELTKYKITKIPLSLGAGIGNTLASALGRAPLSNPWYVSNDGDFLTESLFGPKSILGIGKTRIKIAPRGTQRSDTTLYKTNSSTSDSINKTNDVYTFDNKLISDSVSKGKLKTTTLNSIVDFRQIINSQLSSNSLPQTNYEKFNRESINGKQISSITTYRGNHDGKKRITNPNVAISSDNKDSDYSSDSLLNIIINVYNNDNNNDTPYTTSISFKGYLTAMDDSYTADWDTYKYVGRGESFYKYKGFGRSVSLGFDVVALSRADVVPNYQKLNTLAGLLSPDYSDAGIMRGNFISLTIGDYFVNTPGIIKGVSFAPVFEGGWDINKDENGVNISSDSIVNNNANTPNSSNSLPLYTGVLPKLIKVTGFNFIPVHNFIPRINQAYIGRNYIHNNWAEEEKIGTKYYTSSPGNIILPSLTQPVSPQPSTTTMSTTPSFIDQLDQTF